MDEIENYTCIAVSRHPVSRFVSLYGYLKTINHASASAYNNINSFFDDWVAGKMKDDLYSLRPQNDFIQGVKRNNLEIVKYENLSDAVIIYTGGGSSTYSLAARIQAEHSIGLFLLRETNGMLKRFIRSIWNFLVIKWTGFTITKRCIRINSMEKLQREGC
jgi:hypothetical protein